MTSKELLKCLKDRPCSVCKFRDENGCHKWTCVFEEETEDEPKAKYLINLVLADIKKEIADMDGDINGYYVHKDDVLAIIDNHIGKEK